MKIPLHSLDIPALADDWDEPAFAVQFAVLDASGERHTYGDQSWVAYGGPLDPVPGLHPGGRIQYREITITYGEWRDVP